jgi:hypothetical protein
VVKQIQRTLSPDLVALAVSHLPAVPTGFMRLLEIRLIMKQVRDLPALVPAIVHRQRTPLPVVTSVLAARDPLVSLSTWIALLELDPMLNANIRCLHL